MTSVACTCPPALTRRTVGGKDGKCKFCHGDLLPIPPGNLTTRDVKETTPLVDNIGGVELSDHVYEVPKDMTSRPKFFSKFRRLQ